MRYLKRLLRRITDPLTWLWYRLKMHTLSLDEQYIRESFSYLAQLDMDDFAQATPTIWFQGNGNQLHIVEFWGNTAKTLGEALQHQPIHQVVMKEGKERRVYVDEWRKETREVILEYGARHQTHWWEVYRSGRHIRSTRFLKYLKLLYGEGPPAAASCDNRTNKDHG